MQSIAIPYNYHICKSDKILLQYLILTNLPHVYSGYYSILHKLSYKIVIAPYFLRLNKMLIFTRHNHGYFFLHKHNVISRASIITRTYNTRKAVPHFCAISVYLWTLHLRRSSNKPNLFFALILGKMKECLPIGLFDVR